MGSKTPHITGAELKILKILWDSGPANVRQVKDTLAEQNAEPPAYTTVMTMMKQLAEKGALAVDRSRQPFVYTPAVRKDKILADRVAKFLHSVFDGRAEELVLHLADKEVLSTEDLRRIEAKIEAREKQDHADQEKSPVRKKKK